jgi:hypothetical protein
MIFEYQDAPAVYPHLTSAGMDDLTGWGAISGMVADEDGMIWAVNDSFYGYQPTIFKIDPTQTPARIVDAIRVTRANGQPAQKLDMEGITLDGEGGFWIASEGRTDRVVPHALYHVERRQARSGREIGLPPELMAVERRFGFEGITKVGDTLWMAVQREWKDDPGEPCQAGGLQHSKPRNGARCTMKRPRPKPAGSGCRRSWPMATSSMWSSATTSTISAR